MTDVGSPFTTLQERLLGSFGMDAPHGEHKQKTGVVNYTSANGVATDAPRSTDLEHDGTADEFACTAITERPRALDVGRVLLFLGWKTNALIDNLNETYIGAIPRDPIDGLLSDYAAFRIDLGGSPNDLTAAVKSGGSETTVALGAVEVDQFFFYMSIIIDFDNGRTQFWVETNPFTDPADATISATPNELGPLGGMMGPGSTEFGLLRIAHTGVRYIL